MEFINELTAAMKYLEELAAQGADPQIIETLKYTVGKEISNLIDFTPTLFR